MKEDKKLLVVDIAYLLSEFQDRPLYEIKEQYEAEYDCQVVFIDSPRHNTMVSTTNNNKPIYFA